MGGGHTGAASTSPLPLPLRPLSFYVGAAEGHDASLCEMIGGRGGGRGLLIGDIWRGGWEYASLICISTHRRGWRRCAEGSGVRRGVMTAFRWPLHAGALAFLSLQGGKGSERGPTAAERSGRGESEDVYMRNDRVSYV